jgi:hypothetical protein
VTKQAIDQRARAARSWPSTSRRCSTISSSASPSSAISTSTARGSRSVLNAATSLVRARPSWLRPAIVIELAAFLFMAWAVHASGCSFAAPTRLREHAGFRTIADEVRRFRAGAVRWCSRVF